MCPAMEWELSFQINLTPNLHLNKDCFNPPLRKVGETIEIPLPPPRTPAQALRSHRPLPGLSNSKCRTAMSRLFLFSDQPFPRPDTSCLLSRLLSANSNSSIVPVSLSNANQRFATYFAAKDGKTVPPPHLTCQPTAPNPLLALGFRTSNTN
jgi:hypothetical protein